MNPVTLTVSVSRDEAIRAGLAQYGETSVAIDPAGLSDLARQILASATKAVGSHTQINPNFALSEGVRVAIKLPVTAEHMAAWLEDVATAVQRQAADERAQIDAAIERLRAVPDAHWVETSSYAAAPTMLDPYQVLKGGVSWGIAKKLNEDARTKAIRTDVEARFYKPMRDAWRAQMAEKAAQCQAEAKAQEEAKQAAQARRAAQLVQWVRDHGTEAQHKRMARGLLPDSDIIDAIREATFAPLADLPRYSRMTADEVRGELCPEDDEAEIAFSKRDADTASDETIALIERIEAAIPGATVTLREHVGYIAGADGADDPEMTRHGVHVEVTVGELTLSREYAAP